MLGFSNRNADQAARNMGGCAYFLAGVSLGDLQGVDVVDAAQLEGQVGTYVGPDISWRADYLPFEGVNVLVVTVEPPRWGEGARPARKTFNPEGGGPIAFQAGDILVRHQASTERATPADIDMLNRRAARGGSSGLTIDVRPANETSLRAVDLGENAIEEYVKKEERRLLAPLDSPLAHTMRTQAVLRVGLGTGSGEYRREDEYRTSVDKYLDELRAALPGALRARALLHRVARLKLEVNNGTDTTFTGVRVELLLPGDWYVSDWPDRVREHAEMPEPPALYGTASRASLGLRGGLGPSRFALSHLDHDGGPVLGSRRRAALGGLLRRLLERGRSRAGGGPAPKHLPAH